MAKNATDFQHNILMKLANTGFSQAFYVAPLCLDKNEYDASLYKSIDFLDSPFQYVDYNLHGSRWISYFGDVPFLRMHVSIIPSEHVHTQDHYYSFSQNGTDIVWHSPVFLQQYPSRLSDRMLILFEEAFSNKKAWIEISVLSSSLSQKAVEFQMTNSFAAYSELENIQNFGRELLAKHEIRQMVLLCSTEYLQKLHVL
jgi:hypothetical protein